MELNPGISSTGVFLHSREAPKVMIRTRTGAIVNIGVLRLLPDLPRHLGLRRGEGRLAQITRTFALEAIGHGIRVNAVGAGDCGHNLLIRFAMTSGVSSRTRKLAPIKRAAQPRKSRRSRLLASEKSSFIVGAIVMADGV